MITNELSAVVGHNQETRGDNEFEQALLGRLMEEGSMGANERSVELSNRTQLTCSSCGAELRADSRFCRACGARQEAAPAPAAAQANGHPKVPADVQTSLDRPVSPTSAAESAPTPVALVEPSQERQADLDRIASPEFVAAAGSSQERRGDIEFEQSILARAKHNDTSAITTMFRQFVPPEETITAVQYLGIEGIWGFGTHSFGCLTNRRIAAIRVAFLGEVVYQDGYLEYVNSGVVYQPSKLWLYIYVAVLVLVGLLTPGIPFFLRPLPILLIPFAIRLYYRMFKCGLVLWIREGVHIYMFTNRSRLVVANRMYRMIDKVRAERLKEVGQPI